jgi:hypothetical protein
MSVEMPSDTQNSQAPPDNSENGSRQTQDLNPADPEYLRQDLPAQYIKFRVLEEYIRARPEEFGGDPYFEVRYFDLWHSGEIRELA